MSKKLTVRDIANTEHAVSIVAFPDVCPRCHRHVEPHPIAGVLLAEKSKVQYSFRCPNQKCQELFIGTFSRTPNSTFQISSLSPMSAITPGFPESVTTISPTFVEIYAQAADAETRQLDQLVGIGIRKALEFLVKDYAIHENPPEAESIRKTQLGVCIEKYIQDQNVKQCAKRAAWLGNDETHYVRKWESRDI